MKSICRYEHQSLKLGEEGFNQKHLNALIKLNEFHEEKYFKVGYKKITFKQYVGVIQVDNLLIEIHPKADKYEEDSNWQGVLLNMLKKCGRLKASSSGAANVKRKNLNLLEVYFELYLSEVEKLQRQGLIKQYRKETKNVTALKGKLEFSGHIRHNLVHKERFYT
ncbi:MAG: restriction endonuclease, partial [Vicingaceae bacterium]